MPMDNPQTYRAVSIATPAGENELVLEVMTGWEQLGRGFEYEFYLLSENNNIDLSSVLGKNVTMRLDLMDDKTRYFNGYVSRFSLVEAEERLTRYHMVVVPWTWFLTRTSDCRIFQNKKVPDIIQEVCTGNGFGDIRLKLSRTYKEWVYCVQYRETDFNFISRLMEQEGIYYYFEHENGRHYLVLADSYSAHKAFPGYGELQYLADTGSVRSREMVTDWVIERQVQPGRVELADWNFETPTLPMRTVGSGTKTYANSKYEIYDYPGAFPDTGVGDSYARARMEELEAAFEVARAHTDACGLATGYLFKLTDHPRSDQNKEYLVTGASYRITSGAYHSGERISESLYACDFTAIDSHQPFRTPRVTPKPVIQGPQTAIVVGGGEIYVDKYGRVKVQFHWARNASSPDTSSCWIRVAQFWAGKKWGSMFIPRVGQEVIVEFLEGDPDRPIITGRVYNATNMPPYTLPDEMTKSTIKSSSSPGGGGGNEIRFEDKAGEEDILIFAEKNLDIRAKNDTKEYIGQHRHLIVKGNRKEKVDGDMSLQVGGNLQEKVGMKYAMEAGQEIHLKSGMKIVIEAGVQLTLKGPGGFITIDPAGVTIQGTLVQINSGGAAGSGSGSSPQDPEEALKPDQGEVSSANSRSRQGTQGQTDSITTQGQKNAGGDQGQGGSKNWIGIELKDDKGNPRAGEPYEIELDDGKVMGGALDSEGKAKLVGLDPGSAKIRFPRIEKSEWRQL